jgi:hypothetical protein
VALAKIRSNNDALDGPVSVEEYRLQRISEIIMVELVVFDPVQPHRRTRGYQEIEGRT